MTVALLRAAHIGPGAAVTLVVALLAVATDLEAAAAVALTAAALTGQLTIGWANDLLDAPRDALVGRTDKPVATGQVAPTIVVVALVVAGSACVVLSLLVGWRSGLVHLFLVVACGHAYNLGLKATAWSWLPYAVAFGNLPAAVTLAGATPYLPPWWMTAAGAALGVAAHFLNALPDLDDDAATGIRGIPHRLGPGPARAVATSLLVTASMVAVLAPAVPASAWASLALLATLGLAVVALVGQGRAPFRAAVAIALLDVLLLTGAAR